MKKTMLMGLLMLSMSLALKAQDIIVKRDGSDIKAKVEEISATDIKYRQWDHLSGPLYTISKAEVLRIYYADGHSEVIKPDAKVNTTTAYDSLMRLSKINKAWGVVGCVVGPVFMGAGAAYLIVSLNNKEPALQGLGIALGGIMLAGGLAETILGPVALIKSRKLREEAAALKTGAFLYMPMPVINTAGNGAGIGFRMKF